MIFWTLTPNFYWTFRVLFGVSCENFGLNQVFYVPLRIYSSLELVGAPNRSMVELFFCGVFLVSVEVALDSGIKSQCSRAENFFSVSHSLPSSHLTSPSLRSADLASLMAIVAH